MNEIIISKEVEFEVLNTQTIEQLEEGIWHHKGKMAQSIIEIGSRLIVAKTKLNHGEWGKWLEEKVEISHRTANNWMKVASEFGNTDSQAITNLDGTKLIMLLDVPVDMRDQFMEQNDIKNMTTREMKQAVENLKNSNIEDVYYDGIHTVGVSELKDFPNHEKYFPNIVGKKWMNFLLSIERTGVIEPICITRDKVIVSGHQRVRACKDLGIENICARYFEYDKDRDVTYDEQLKRRFCGENCSSGQMELYTNAKRMLGLEDGVLETATDIIKRNKEKNTLGIIQIGEDLIEIKKELDDEHFEILLKNEMGFDIEVANIYIQIANEYRRTNKIPTKLADDILEGYIANIYKMVFDC